jgi:hypothetical protein
MSLWGSSLAHFPPAAPDAANRAVHTPHLPTHHAAKPRRGSTLHPYGQ